MRTYKVTHPTGDGHPFYVNVMDDRQVVVVQRENGFWTHHIWSRTELARTLRQFRTERFGFHITRI